MARIQLAVIVLSLVSATSVPKSLMNKAALHPSAQSSMKPDGESSSSFLIARRGLQDPRFQKTVVLMLPVVDKDAIVGLIVNKPTRITLHVLFPKNSVFKDETDVAYFGGPVDVTTVGVLFRSSKEFKRTFHLSGDLYVTFDPDLVGKIMKKPKEVSESRLFLGRSQWGADQLAREMELRSWFREKEKNDVIFRTDSANVWLELIEELDPGDVAHLSSFYSSSAAGM
ncbi:MAG: YqgE/AlgH family protein [Candidatus Acidiferrales bacterium]